LGAEGTLCPTGVLIPHSEEEEGVGEILPNYISQERLTFCVNIED